MKEGYMCLGCSFIKDKPKCSCKDPEIVMVRIVEDGDRAFTNGAYITRKGKTWIVDGFEDDSFYDGELMQTAENGWYTGLPQYHKEAELLNSISDRDLPLHIDREWEYELNQINFNKRLSSYNLVAALEEVKCKKS